VHYWGALLNRRPQEHELRDIESFQRIERRIYELAGHQKEIDSHFEFARILLNAMKIDLSFYTPKINELSSGWHKCSELCHISWPLGSSVQELRKQLFANLTEISQELSVQASSAIGWPILHDAQLIELRTKFIAGQVTKEDVLAQLQQRGMWAQAEFKDGRAFSVGEPISPSVPTGK
jgi:hypothetical protein